MGIALAAVLRRFQSTLPRGERQKCLDCFSGQVVISIHAPARGATHPPDHDSGDVEISIHAPARGATKRFSVFSWSSRFQSTLPRGERPEAKGLKVYLCLISIHAPARGATKIDAESKRRIGFQSTLPRGERQQF